MNSPNIRSGIMISTTRETLPIRLTNFFLSIAGFAIPTTRNEGIVVTLAAAYCTVVLVVGCCVTGIDIYYCWGSFNEFVYSFIGFGSCFISQSKFTAFMLQRRKYIRLMKYTSQILWTKYHNDYGKYVIKKCEKQAMYFIIVFALLAQSVGLCYVVQPLLLNIGRNGTDRFLPFTLWIGPIYITPWYEIAYAVQILSSYHTSICYFCFDNYLALMNIFVAGQFKILRNRLETLFDTHDPLIEFDNHDKEMQKLYVARRSTIRAALHEFKKCAKQHQILINLVEDIEDIYSFINLVQVLVFSFLICLVGYQLILPGNSTMRRILFVVYFGGCFTQLFSFAFTCNNLTIASSEISEGLLHSKWNEITWCEEGRTLVRDMRMVTMKAQRPCQLTAFGFFPVTLNTFKSMLSTAFSYLTLMRNSEEQMQ